MEASQFQLVEKMVQAWFPSDSEEAAENKALLFKLECARLGQAALKEKNMAMTVYKTEGTESASFEKALTSALRCWMRYLETADKGGEFQKSKVVSFGFDSILAMDDKGLLDLWAAFANRLKSKVTGGIEAVRGFMEIGANWKESASEDMSIEQLIALSENSLMMIKGKKLNAAKDALSQAGLFCCCFCLNHKMIMLTDFWANVSVCSILYRRIIKISLVKFEMPEKLGL